jgi:hypothetical protein
MKTIIITIAMMLQAATYAQDNRPKSTVSGVVTGNENITGAIKPRSNAVANPEITETTAVHSTTTQRAVPVQTLYGRNNDGSSTGSTVTGSGASNAEMPREDNSPGPGNKAGTWIVTPRPR